MSFTKKFKLYFYEIIITINYNNLRLIIECQTVIMHHPAVYQNQIGYNIQIGYQRSKDIRV